MFLTGITGFFLIDIGCDIDEMSLVGLAFENLVNQGIGSFDNLNKAQAEKAKKQINEQKQADLKTLELAKEKIRKYREITLNQMTFLKEKSKIFKQAYLKASRDYFDDKRSFFFAEAIDEGYSELEAIKISYNKMQE